MRAFRRTCAGASEPQPKVIGPDQRGRPFVSAINRRKSSFGMLPSFSDLNGTLAWDIGIGTGNRGKSSRASSLQIFMSQTRGHTCSVLLPDIIGHLRNPLQHWSDFNITPAKRGELLFLKGKRHRIDISSWQRAAVYYGRSYAVARDTSKAF